MNEFRLFAHGETFDVDAFLTSTTLRPDYIWRRGDPRRGYEDIKGLGHPTSGIEFVLGDGLVVPFREQEGIAVAYLTVHRDAVRTLAQFPGAGTFILGLQYRRTFEHNVIGFSLSPSARLMWHCLDIGCEPTYYVTLDRLPEPEIEGDESQEPWGGL